MYMYILIHLHEICSPSHVWLTMVNVNVITHIYKHVYSPSPRAPPPTRSLGGTSMQVPSYLPPVQMPTGEAGGLGGRAALERPVAETRVPPPTARTRGTHPTSTSSSLSAFRHSSPPRASAARQRAWEATPSPDASHVLDEPSMGGYSQQVPGHVAPHTVISPVLSLQMMSPDSTLSTPPRVTGSKSRDRWPLPPLPQRTPVHGRQSEEEPGWGTLSWADESANSARADTQVMSDMPHQHYAARKHRDYERERSKSADRDRTAPAHHALDEDEDKDAEDMVTADDRSRPYREDTTMDAAHQRIQQRKEAEHALQERLMGHLGQLPSRRETELARAVCIHICMCIYICVCIYIHTYIYIYIYTYTYTYMYIYREIHISMSIYTYLCMCVYIHT